MQTRMEWGHNTALYACRVTLESELLWMAG